MSSRDKCWRRSIRSSIATKSTWPEPRSMKPRPNCGGRKRSLARLRVEVPIQIEIAKRTLAAAEADLARAKEALRLTTDEVEKSIQEAQAGLELAQADLVLAQQEYDRFTALYQREAIPLERSQQVTRARDVAVAQKNLASAKLAKAEAARTQIVRGPAGRGSGRKTGPEGRGRREAGGDGKRSNQGNGASDRPEKGDGQGGPTGAGRGGG